MGNINNHKEDYLGLDEETDKYEREGEIYLVKTDKSSEEMKLVIKFDRHMWIIMEGKNIEGVLKPFYQRKNIKPSGTYYTLLQARDLIELLGIDSTSIENMKSIPIYSKVYTSPWYLRKIARKNDFNNYKYVAGCYDSLVWAVECARKLEPEEL